VTTPAVQVEHALDGLDGSVQALHRYLRNGVLASLPPSRTRPIETNAWGFVREEMTEEKLKQAVEVTAAAGATVYH